MLKRFHQIRDKIQNLQDDAADFYAISFSSNRKSRNIVLDIYIILLLFPIFPFNILGGSLTNDFNLFIGTRIQSDKEYLTRMGLADFANTYISGITWQFLATLGSFIVIFVLYARASPRVIIRKNDYGLFLGLALSSAGAALGIYALFFMNDFEFGGTNISWFNDNATSNMKLLPQPMNRLVFLTTGASFLLIMVNALWILPMTISLFFGRPLSR